MAAIFELFKLARESANEKIGWPGEVGDHGSPTPFFQQYGTYMQVQVGLD